MVEGFIRRPSDSQKIFDCKHELILYFDFDFECSRVRDQNQNVLSGWIRCCLLRISSGTSLLRAPQTVVSTFMYRLNKTRENMLISEM